MASDESADAFTSIVNRLEALDQKLEDRFAALDRTLDARFAAVDERFDKEHSHFQALYEASRADFNNLFDFVKASAHATNARSDQLEADNTVRFADIHAAVAALARRVSMSNHDR